MSDTGPLRMRRESSGAPHASLVYNFVVVWVVYKNFCFPGWLFAITVMSSFWRYLFVGISLMTWPNTWPVGIDHCSGAQSCIRANKALVTWWMVRDAVDWSTRMVSATKF